MGLVTLILASAAAAPFMLAILAAILYWHHVPGGMAPQPARLARPRLARPAVDARELDVGQLLRDAAHDLEALARSHAVRINLAVSPGRRILADQFALSTALREVITAAIHAAAGGQILVSALPLGTWLHIAITDDGRDTPRTIRESIVREAGGTMALIGGSIAMEALAGRGTTFTAAPSRAMASR